MRRRTKTDWSKKKSRKPTFFLVLGGILTLALFSLLYVWQRMETVRLVKEIGILEKQYAEYEKTKEYLTLEVARLSSPQQLYPRAEASLGLVPTDISRQVACADPANRNSTESWKRMLAALKDYSKKAWNLSETEALAKETK